MTALKTLHGLGFVHGDLKPNNILIERGHPLEDVTSRNIIYLVDFGLSVDFIAYNIVSDFKATERV